MGKLSSETFHSFPRVFWWAGVWTHVSLTLLCTVQPLLQREVGYWQCGARGGAGKLSGELRIPAVGDFHAGEKPLAFPEPSAIVTEGAWVTKRRLFCSVAPVQRKRTKCMLCLGLYTVGKQRLLSQGDFREEGFGDLGLQNPSIPRQLASCPGLLALGTAWVPSQLPWAAKRSYKKCTWGSGFTAHGILESLTCLSSLNTEKGVQPPGGALP